MLLLTLALATMPQPVGKAVERDLTSLSAMLSETRAAGTRVDLTVDAAGLPVRCDVTLSEGSRALDRTACDHLMRRARFTPARDAAGAPIPAVVRLDMTVNQSYGPTGGGAPGGRVDFALRVDRVPPPGGVAVADLVLTTDAAGRVTTCDVVTSSTVAGLDRVACREMMAASFAPARGRDGAAMPALRQVSVGFTAGDVPR